MSGKLIIVCAPSGAGKTTIVRHILENIPGIEFSVSATNRKQRPTEVNGLDYYFIDTDDFTTRIAKGDFLEWEEVYPGTFYGTLKTEIDRIWNRGNHVIFDVDVEGGVAPATNAGSNGSWAGKSSIEVETLFLQQFILQQRMEDLCQEIISLFGVQRSYLHNMNTSVKR